MSSNVTGFQAHRSPQHLDMDLAWQELMAITELQVSTLEHPTKLAFFTCTNVKTQENLRLFYGRIQPVILVLMKWWPY